MKTKNPAITQLLENVRYVETASWGAESYAFNRADYEQNTVAMQYTQDDPAYWYWQGYAAGRRKGAELVGNTVRRAIHKFCPPLPTKPLQVVVDNTKPKTQDK